MSLINDALQRAKSVQQNQPPADAPPLQFRPLEPGQPSAKGPGLVLPATLGTILIAGILSWWLLRLNSGTASASKPLPVAAASAVPAPAPPLPATDSKPATAASARESAKDPGSLETAKAPAPVSVPASISIAVQTPATNDVTAVPPPPAAPRLQAIVFNSIRSSAIISGKTVFVGDRFREFRVVAITADTVTLVSATQTNVFTME